MSAAQHWMQKRTELYRKVQNGALVKDNVRSPPDWRNGNTFRLSCSIARGCGGCLGNHAVRYIDKLIKIYLPNLLYLLINIHYPKSFTETDGY